VAHYKFGLEVFTVCQPRPGPEVEAAPWISGLEAAHWKFALEAHWKFGLEVSKQWCRWFRLWVQEFQRGQQQAPSAPLLAVATAAAAPLLRGTLRLVAHSLGRHHSLVHQTRRQGCRIVRSQYRLRVLVWRGLITAASCPSVRCPRYPDHATARRPQRGQARNRRGTVQIILRSCMICTSTFPVAKGRP